MRVVDYLPSFDDSSSGIAACLSHFITGKVVDFLEVPLSIGESQG